MGGCSHQKDSQLQLSGAGGCDSDCYRSEHRKQVSSSGTHPNKRAFNVTGFPVRSRIPLWRSHICSCFRKLQAVSLPSRTRVSSIIRGGPRYQALLGVCIGLSLLLWLFSRDWHVFQLKYLLRYAPLLNHLRDEESEKFPCTISTGDPDGQGQAAFTGHANSSIRTLQSNGHIHPPCKPASKLHSICHETAFRKWHTSTALRKNLPPARGVWMLLSRRKRRNVSTTDGTSTQQCCQLSAAERHLSTQRLSPRHHLPGPFSRVFDSSPLLMTPPAIYLRKSVLGSRFDATDPRLVSSMQVLTGAPQALQTGRDTPNSIEKTGREDHVDGKGTFASLFDIWQQLEPLSLENKQFLIQRLTEKALSHVMWFYEWQKKNAIPLLLQYLLQQAGGVTHRSASYETGLETDYATNESEDEDDDDDDDVEDSQPAERDFSAEHSTLKRAVFYDEKVTPSHDKRTHNHGGQLNVVPGRHNGTAVFADRSAAAVVNHSLSNNTDELDNTRILTKRAEMSADDETIRMAGNAKRTYDARDNAEAHFITPGSNTWFPEVEIDQEYYNAGLSVLGNTFSALVTKDIPNITVTIDRLNQHIGTYLQFYKDAVWSLPLQQIVNATLNGGMFPPLVQFQNSSYPDFKRDVRCNPDVQVCQNLGSFLRAVGGLTRRVYHSTYPYNVHLRAEAAANLLHTLVVGQRVTPTFFSFVEQIVTVAVLETVLNATTSFIEIPPESQLFALINAILSFIGEVYSLADVPAAEMEQTNLIRSKVRTAIYCRIFNGRLPYCNPSPVSLIPAPQIPRELVFDPFTGFVKFLFFTGFEAACIQRGGCFADLFIEGGNFDGFYFLLGVGSTGFPVYQGYRFFQQFLELTRLFFWQGLRPSVIDSSQGSWAGITSVPESYFTATKGQLNPFASLATLTSPNNCSDFPPVPFGDTTTNFPLCLNVSRQWVVGRVAALGNCNGFLYSHVCVFPSTVIIFPTPSPEFWTVTATTSTVAPPGTTTPRTPPGGGVPPGGTAGGAGVSLAPMGKHEEGHLGGGSKAEYLFWEEADSPFGTSYPWERKNLLSGWTGRRRGSSRRSSDRRLANAQSSLPALRKRPVTKRILSFRHVGSGRNTADRLPTVRGGISVVPAGSQLRSDQLREKRDNDMPLRVKDEYRTAMHVRPAILEKAPFVPEMKLLHGEPARRAVAKRLEGLNGMNGRRFQSSIPVHRSQFVDGFSGRLLTHIPPFFPIPPDLL